VKVEGRRSQDLPEAVMHAPEDGQSDAAGHDLEVEQPSPK
jgi:hypothetical protein